MLELQFKISIMVIVVGLCGGESPLKHGEILYSPLALELRLREWVDAHAYRWKRGARGSLELFVNRHLLLVKDTCAASTGQLNSKKAIRGCSLLIEVGITCVTHD